MIKIISYFFAFILMIYSLWAAPTHFRPIPTYLKLRLTNPYVLRGLSASLLTVLSIGVSIFAFIKADLFWFIVTLVFILFNVLFALFMVLVASGFID